MKFLSITLLILFYFSEVTQTSEIASFEGLKEEISGSYELLLNKQVIDDLIVNHDIYLQSSTKYWEFLERTFLDHWDFDATTRALIGQKILSQLPNFKFEELSRAVEVTLIRYAFESLHFYSGQKISVIDITINEKQTFAWLKINMESPRFPDIHLDLLLKRTDDDQWKGADFRFKGITYVNLKKNSYRQDFKDSKFVGLLKKLDKKNKLFFEDLCQSTANYVDPKRPPCLQNYDKK